MTESDGRDRKNTGNRSVCRPILWYNTQYSDRISRSLCPLSFRAVEANDYRAALLLFYEQNNISAFKKMFLEQIEFAMKEYFDPMKPFARMNCLSVALRRLILVSSLALAAGCEFGPISHERVVDSLSRYVSESVARQIVNDDKNVSPETLAELSGKRGIGYDEMTILLLHPNFPQERRSDLIRRGKSAHYLANASGVQRQTITDEDVKAMLKARGINDYLWRQTLECGGLAPDTYRSVYRKWVSHALYDDLKDNRFLVASSHLPKDVREDLLRRLSGVSIAPFILREHKRLSGSGADGAADVVEYMHVVDGWRREVSFYVRCDTLNGAGSLYELVAKSRHYSTLEELGKDVGEKRLQKVSDVGRCSMQYEIL